MVNSSPIALDLSLGRFLKGLEGLSENERVVSGSLIVGDLQLFDALRSSRLALAEVIESSTSGYAYDVHGRVHDCIYLRQLRRGEALN